MLDKMGRDKMHYRIAHINNSIMENKEEVLREMKNIDAILSDVSSRKIADLLKNMLILDPSKRKTAEELCEIFNENLKQFHLTRANTKLNQTCYRNTFVDTSNGEMQVRDRTFCVRIIKPRALSRSAFFRHLNLIK